MRAATALRSAAGEDAPWLAVLLAVSALELAWWVCTWSLGFSPPPRLVFVALAFGALAVAFGLRSVVLSGSPRPNWAAVIPATLMIGLGASVFLPLKYAIPHLLPFWLDPALAHAERAVLAIDPWALLDKGFGWAAVPLDRLYGLWLPTQTLFLFVVMLHRGSAAKSQALIAYVLAWFVLGVLVATLFASAGPIFYDRVFGGTHFAALRAELQQRGAWVALSESDRMWESLASGQPGIVAGISAVPSIHVAISVWMVLVSRLMAPRTTTLALAYACLILIGSVQLGWHYVTDGLVSLLAMVAIWRWSGKLEKRLSKASR